MRWLVMAAMLSGLLGVPPAMADGLCAMRDQVVPSLSQEFGEAPVGRGLTPDGDLIELFLSADGTFTILVTSPHGISCGVAAGRDWDFIPDDASKSPLSQERI